MSDDNPKPSGSGTDPMQRLASLKPMRDLTLGAPKPNKKVFLPNLNITRNKNKGPTVPGSQGAKKDDKSRKDRKNDKNKNTRGPNIIKSTGVFSEGVGNVERHFSRGSFSREADTAPSLQKPTIRVKDVIKIDKELEEQKIRSVMGEGSGLNAELESDGPSVDFKLTKEVDAPIKLPMGDSCWTEPAPVVKVKQEVVVKTEPEEFDTPSGGKERLVRADVKREPCEQTEVVNLLNKTEPTLILLQLPDSLPGRGGRREEPRRGAPSGGAGGAPGGTGGAGGASAPDTPAEHKSDEDRCYLSDLEEGRIGTLRTHRSGRVSLLLGDTVFEVNMGTKPAFHQEVVSTACDDESRSASLISLGPLEHKLSIVPQWETMFKDLPK